MRSSFEDLVTRNPTVKMKLNSDAYIKSYSFLNFLDLQINARGQHLFPYLKERSTPPTSARAPASYVRLFFTYYVRLQAQYYFGQTNRCATFQKRNMVNGRQIQIIIMSQITKHIDINGLPGNRTPWNKFIIWHTGIPWVVFFSGFFSYAWGIGF